jgi:hypothetical protein
VEGKRRSSPALAPSPAIRSAARQIEKLAGPPTGARAWWRSSPAARLLVGSGRCRLGEDGACRRLLDGFTGWARRRPPVAGWVGLLPRGKDLAEEEGRLLEELARSDERARGRARLWRMRGEKLDARTRWSLPALHTTHVEEGERDKEQEKGEDAVVYILTWKEKEWEKKKEERKNRKKKRGKKYREKNERKKEIIQLFL